MSLKNGQPWWTLHQPRWMRHWGYFNLCNRVCDLSKHEAKRCEADSAPDPGALIASQLSLLLPSLSI